MNQKELKELIEFLIEKDITEFELERGDVKVRIKRAQEPQYIQVAQPMSAPAAGAPIHTAAPVVTPGAHASAAPGMAPAAPAVEPEEDFYIVKSPIVGTFYEAPSPGSPPFVKVGDTVSAGQALCIVEAMKLMNEIETEVGGEIAKILVANGQPVEYGQALFAIRPR